MKLFQELGREIEDTWRAHNYDETALPDISADALRHADIPSKMSVWDVVEWGLGERELPPQRDVNGNFGDPPITIFSGPRFHIDVYFWFEGTTSVHQHSFCGAFQVMHGSSIHSWYEFDRETSINTFTELGNIRLKSCDLLSVGDIQRILAGPQYIHSLFHLDQPSATIVVRTDRSPLFPPQYNYLKPGLAIDPFFGQDTVTKKLQLVSALLRAKHPDTDRLVTAWLADCDLQTTYGLLTRLRGMLHGDQLDELFKLATPEARFQHFVEVAEKRHGPHIASLKAAFEHEERVREIVNRRGFVTDPELRFFLALLMNVDGKEQIYRLINQRFPDSDPLEKTLDWIFDLANTRIVGTERNNALGIDDFGDTDIFVLERILKGDTGPAIEEAFRTEYGDASEIDLAGKEERIRNAAIFKPLLV